MTRRAPAPPMRLRLYVAGTSPNSKAALANVRSLFADRPAPRLEVVDVLEQAERALRDGILVTPTLVRLDPPPTVYLVGSLGDPAAVLDALGLEEES